MNRNLSYLESYMLWLFCAFGFCLEICPIEATKENRLIESRKIDANTEAGLTPLSSKVPGFKPPKEHVKSYIILFCLVHTYWKYRVPQKWDLVNDVTFYCGTYGGYMVHYRDMKKLKYHLSNGIDEMNFRGHHKIKNFFVSRVKCLIFFLVFWALCALLSLLAIPYV